MHVYGMKRIATLSPTRVLWTLPPSTQPDAIFVDLKLNYQLM